MENRQESPPNPTSFEASMENIFYKEKPVKEKMSNRMVLRYKYQIKLMMVDENMKESICHKKDNFGGLRDRVEESHKISSIFQTRYEIFCTYLSEKKNI
jgi:hypothetical protein